MGLQSLEPPRPGAYVEISKGHYRTVAQVIWSQGQRFGVRTQDDVDLHRMSTQGLQQNKRRTDNAANDGLSAKWRPLPKRHAEAAERNRLLGRATEFACLAFGTAAAAVLVFEGLQYTLHETAVQLVEAMSGPQQ